MTKLLTPGAACVIPESLGGMPVTELADRGMAGQPVKEVYLPGTLRRIGRYGFYKCEQLQILHFYAGTREIGGGIFNGCKKIRELYVHMGEDEQSALRDFVTEISERLVVHYILPDGKGGEREAARLVFPEFYDEAVENTPARNLSFAIHGSGQKYRYCFGNRKILFDRYDKVFPHEIYEEPAALAAEIAIHRLTFPYGLLEGARIQYEAFLEEHLYEVLLANLQDGAVFKWLIGQFAECGGGNGTVKPGRRLSEGELDHLILQATQKRLPEISGVLLDLKHQMYPAVKKKFEF